MGVANFAAFEHRLFAYADARIAPLGFPDLWKDFQRGKPYIPHPTTPYIRIF